VALLAEAVGAGGRLEALEADCRLLTPYAVMFRYPAIESEPSEPEARQAVAAAERIYKGVQAAL
jgi:HEPN domain-containing protein